VFVDHVQELEYEAIIGRSVERDVHSPHLVRLLGPVTAHRAISGPCPLSLPGSGALQSLLAPESLDPLSIDGPTLAPQQAVGRKPAPADVLGCNLAETMTRLSLLERDYLDGPAQGAAMLTDHTEDKPLRSPATLLQHRNGPMPALRAQKFDPARSLSIAFSSSASARTFLRRVLSFFA